MFALPISVIGKNFSKELDVLHGREADFVSKAFVELLGDFSTNPDFEVSSRTAGKLNHLVIYTII